MKRANKILMVTVAILLSLVLLSTSLVSGIFARFVVKKQADTTVGLEKFGVELTLTPRADALIKKSESKAGDSVQIAYEALPLYPGADYSELLNIEIKSMIIRSADMVRVAISMPLFLSYPLRISTSLSW